MTKLLLMMNHLTHFKKSKWIQKKMRSRKSDPLSQFLRDRLQPVESRYWIFTR